jgi:hypothetical protein
MQQTMINKDMKHFIYKTTHCNGKYYIGRHSTKNLNDGYLGSGRWVTGIKDRASLTREIIDFVDNEETLLQREGELINEHFGKEGCMNLNPNPIGFAPNNLNPNKDGKNAKQAIINGTHINLTNNPSIKKSKEGRHQWQHGNSPNHQGKLNKKLVEEGRHNFLGPEMNKKRVEEGTHNFVGSEANLARLAAGTHPSQQKKTCEHCGKTASVGMYKRWHGDNCKFRIS